MRIVEMTGKHAADIATWRYPAPYRNYDLDGADPAFFLDPANGYLALVDGEGEGDGEVLIGYRSFGADGQVPGGRYDDSALDTGGGLRPELTGLGRGLGRRAVAAGLAHGCRVHRPAAFRVTVAAFNERARRVVTSLGFRPTAEFRATADGTAFVVLVLPDPDEALLLRAAAPPS